MAGKDPPQEMRAIVLQLLMMRAMQAEVVPATMAAAMAATMSAAGGRFADRCDGGDRGHDQHHSDATTARRPPRWHRVNVISEARHGTAVGDASRLKDPPGRIRPGGPPSRSAYMYG
jgi:hypothetical protein